MTSIEKNLKIAKEAVELTRQILHLGMGNYMNDPQDPRYISRLKAGRAAGGAIGTSIEAVQRKLFGGSMGIGKPMVGWIGEQIAKYGPETALLHLRLSMLPEELLSALQGMYAKATGNAKVHREIHIDEMSKIAKSAANLGAGNCTEHACLCYVLLLNDVEKPRPLEVLLSPDHAFCCIGRLNNQDPEDWGDETIIVDAYYGEYYLIENGKLRQRQLGATKSNGRVE